MKSAAIWLDSAECALNTGLSWSLAWAALLEVKPHFSETGSLGTSWPLTAPVAIVQESPFCPPLLPNRGSRLAHFVAQRIGRHLKALRKIAPNAQFGCVIGTSHGECGAVSYLAEVGADHASKLDAATLMQIVDEDFVEPVLSGLDIDVTCQTISSACASGLVALDVARRSVEVGRFDAAVVICADPLSRIAYAGFSQLGIVSTRGCRPFQPDRDGTTIAEGAIGFIVVSAAIAEHVPDCFPILGAGFVCDARHPVEPTAVGISTAIARALCEAKLDSAQIQSAVWHGTGTRQNDRAEATASQQVFGERLIPSLATKAVFGHTMGASSAISALAACQAIRDNILPPANRHSATEFPALDFSPVRRPIQAAPSLVTALGFGGINAAVIIGRNELD